MNLRFEKITAWPLCLLLIIGFVFVGDGDVLCIGDDGHVQVEPECLPSCRSVEPACDLDSPKDIHHEHDDCHGCSDLILNGKLWSKRSRKISPSGPVNCLPVFISNSPIILSSTVSRRPEADQVLLTFDQSPLSVALASTCLRC